MINIKLANDIPHIHANVATVIYITTYALKFKMKNQIDEDHIIPYRIRPRFEIETTYKIDELVEVIQNALDDDPAIDAKIVKGYANLYIVKEDQHYWSPQLSLNATEIETGTSLRGVYGPRPSVWTMFVFFYSIIGFAILVVGLFGMTNYSLGNPAPILWLIPILAIIFLSLYLTSYFGQKLGYDQMLILHHFVEKTIGVEIR